MRRILGLLTILTFLVSCNSNITPNGNVIEETIDINSFDELDISSGISVEFSQSDKDSVVIETFASVIPHVIFRKLGNSLNISLDKNCPYDNISALKVKIWAKDLSSVKATEDSHIKILTHLTSTNFEIYLNDKSSFSIKEDKELSITSSLLANLELGSKCTIYGFSEKLTANLNTGSTFSTFDFITEIVDEVSVNMRSIMEISVSKSFRFIAEGGSIIKYKGEGIGSVYASGGSTIQSL